MASSTSSAGEEPRSPTSLAADLAPPLSRRKEVKVGFDCSFVEPPKEIKSDCPVCLHVIRDPQQTSCCGSIYCNACIERVRIGKQPCPWCRNTEFNIFPDRAFRRSLYSLKVWCCHKDKGCDWSDELNNLDNHLNLSSKSASRFMGCKYIQLLCFTCKTMYPRSELELHESRHCLKRRYTCEFCSDYESDFEDVMKNHWPKCLYRPIPCSNKCGVYPLQKDLGHHIEAECICRTEEVDVQNIKLSLATGSVSEKDLRKIIDVCVEAQVTNVLSGVLRKTAQENDRKLDELRAEVICLKVAQAEFQTSLKQELQVLKSKEEENRQFIVSLKNHLLIVPVTFKIDSYEKRKSQDTLGWTSPPFYTHPCGYRMRLVVDVRGDKRARGTHTSVFLHLTKGEFDDQLKWPIRGCITIELLNQNGGESHVHMIRYHSGTPNASAEKVADISKSWGKSQFIDRVLLEDGGFVLEDFLKFRISKFDLLV